MSTNPVEIRSYDEAVERSKYPADRSFIKGGPSRRFSRIPSSKPQLRKASTTQLSTNGLHLGRVVTLRRSQTAGKLHGSNSTDTFTSASRQRRRDDLIADRRICSTPIFALGTSMFRTPALEKRKCHHRQSQRVGGLVLHVWESDFLLAGMAPTLSALRAFLTFSFQVVTGLQKRGGKNTLPECPLRV